ncbi:MAG: PEGA domain-containing protein [Treponema sp.]|jgi:hypothetical protein|nr:PEGA domain-containing protein [Treponema sp.]
MSRFSGRPLRRIVVGIFLFFLVPRFFCFSDTYHEAAGAGLFIGSVPSGARVFIDGIERGTTPFSLESLRAGEYSIRIVKEGYVERRFTVTARRSSRVEVSVDLEEAKGQVLLEIRRDPAAPPSLALDPRIYVDGSPAEAALSGPAGGAAQEDGSGSSGVISQSLAVPTGWRTIAVEAFGWERNSKNLFIAQGTAQKLELILVPAPFRLSGVSLRKKRINPENSGALGMAEIGFEVSGPGAGNLEVLDEGGRVIHTAPLGPFTGRRQRALWDGRETAAPDSPGAAIPGAAADGSYRLRISAWALEEGQAVEETRQTAELAVEIDSSVRIRPLTLSSSSPGLLFASAPELLPARSYQIEGAMLAGKPPAEEAWKSLPFSAGFRVSLLDRLEAAGVFNAVPEFSEGTGLGAGVSVKWALLAPSRNREGERDGKLGAKLGAAGLGAAGFGAAAEFSYGWAREGPYTPFGMGTGAALRFPLSYRILEHPLSVDLLGSPLLLWAGEEGYPGGFVPRLGLEGGVLLAYKSLAGGLSIRWDYAPPGTEPSGPGPLASALELKFFPSNLVFSLAGGFWYWKNSAGAFFGAGIGVVY